MRHAMACPATLLPAARQHRVDRCGAPYCVVLDVPLSGGAHLPRVPAGARRWSRWLAMKDLQAIRPHAPSARIARLCDEPRGVSWRTALGRQRQSEEVRHDERSQAPSNT